MRAALAFVRTLEKKSLLQQVRRIRTDLYGSLALTGLGHATDRAVLLGLSGELPDQVDPAKIEHLPRISYETAIEMAERGCELVQRLALDADRERGLQLVVRTLDDALPVPSSRRTPVNK